MRLARLLLPLGCLGVALVSCSNETNDERLVNLVPPPQLTSPHIAFVSNRSGANAVYLFNLETRSTLRLTPDSTEESSPAIAPDGKRIAVTVKIGTSYHILTMAVDGTDRMPITSSTISSDFFPRWSPDGQQIAFTRYNPATQFSGVYTVPASGGGVSPVTDDGTSILFDWCSAGILLAQNGDSLYTIRPDGTGGRRIPVSVCGWAQYSPDATQIAVSTVGSSPQIFLIDADGGGGIELTAGILDSCAHPTWSPDGTQIAFQGTNGDLPTQIVTISAGGRNPAQLFVTDANESLPDWGPRSSK